MNPNTETGPAVQRCHLRACIQETGREVFIREGAREELQAEADRMNAAGRDYFVWPPLPTLAQEEARFKPPYDNCSFKLCDLPGQCRGEGKCHHPAQAKEARG